MAIQVKHLSFRLPESAPLNITWVIFSVKQHSSCDNFELLAGFVKLIMAAEKFKGNKIAYN